MKLLQVVLLIVMVASLFEWDHLKQNKIRHDETPFLYIALLFGVILLGTILFPEYFGITQ